MVKVSAKSRYALASATRMAQLRGDRESVTLIRLAEELRISKIYLEQIFALLKRGGVVTAVKGARGGYRLARSPERITSLEILRAMETDFFASPGVTVAESAPDIERALIQLVFARLDEAVGQALADLTLADLALEAEKSRGENYMYYL